MPTYEYKCDNCREITEAFQKISAEPLTKCPKCGVEALHRIVSGGAGVLYKGEGWYVTDYSHKSSGGKEPPTTSASKEGAPESKTSSETKPSTESKSAPSKSSSSSSSEEK